MSTDSDHDTDQSTTDARDSHEEWLRRHHEAQQVRESILEREHVDAARGIAHEGIVRALRGEATALERVVLTDAIRGAARPEWHAAIEAAVDAGEPPDAIAQAAGSTVEGLRRRLADDGRADLLPEEVGDGPQGAPR